jgi:hypothetical protein
MGRLCFELERRGWRGIRSSPAFRPCSDPPRSRRPPHPRLFRSSPVPPERPPSSNPGPHQRVLLPPSPRRPSLPGPPFARSSPGPPQMRSSPPRPWMTSSPPRPTMTSFPAVPSRTSAPCVPTIVAGRPVQSGNHLGRGVGRPALCVGDRAPNEHGYTDDQRAGKMDPCTDVVRHEAFLPLHRAAESSSEVVERLRWARSPVWSAVEDLGVRDVATARAVPVHHPDVRDGLRPRLAEVVSDRDHGPVGRERE